MIDMTGMETSLEIAVKFREMYLQSLRNMLKAQFEIVASGLEFSAEQMAVINKNASPTVDKLKPGMPLGRWLNDIFTDCIKKQLSAIEDMKAPTRRILLTDFLIYAKWNIENFELILPYCRTEEKNTSCKMAPHDVSTLPVALAYMKDTVLPALEFKIGAECSLGPEKYREKVMQEDKRKRKARISGLEIIKPLPKELWLSSTRPVSLVTLQEPVPALAN